MTKPLTKEEKERRRQEREKGGSATATASKNGNGKKHNKKKGGKQTATTTQVEATPEVAAATTAPVEAAPENVAVAPSAALPASEAGAVVHPPEQPAQAAAPPPKKTLTTEQTVDAGLMKLAKDEIRDREELQRIGRQKEQLRAVIAGLGLEVPNDTTAPKAVRQKGSNGKPKGSPTAPAPGRGKGAGGKSLWEITKSYLSQYGYIDPKFCEASKLFELASKNGYTTAANLLSQKAKSGELVKGGRGEYALPKGYKRKN